MLLLKGLTFLPLAIAMSVRAPTPAPTPDPVVEYQSPEAPSPTPKPLFRHRNWEYYRRDANVTDTYRFDQETPEACGFYNGYYSESWYGCVSSYSCVSHGQDLSYPNMFGCCSSNECEFATTCVGASEISESPSHTNSPQAFSLYCSESSMAYCQTLIYSDIGFTDYACGDVNTLWVMYTTGLSYYSTGTLVDRYDAYLTPVDDDVVGSYAASFSTGSSMSKTTATPTSSPDSESDSDSSDSSSAGPIAGGVVGGVAGVAAIAAAGFFFLRKRKSKQPDPDAGYHDNGGDYKPVPEPSQLPDAQMPSEMGSSDPVHNLAEAPGQAGAYELGSTPTGTDKRNFVAELPGDTHTKR